MPRKKSTKTKVAKISNSKKAFVEGLLSTLGVDQIANGLAQALGLGEGIGGGNNFMGPMGYGTQLNQTDTIFMNNRWYLISNMRQVLSEAYAEHGLIATICDVPCADAFRGGIKIKTQQLEAEEIEKLQATMAREGDLQIALQANIWNRLYGGAGILIITDQDPEEELDVDEIDVNSSLEFRSVDMWELFWDKQSTEGYSPELQQEVFEHYNYYSKTVHKSRVMKLKGITAPSFIRPRLRGWGLSVIERLVNSINQYLKTNNLIFEVLDEFKVDVYKIKNLASTLLSPNGQQRIFERTQLANQQKNFQNAITMDAEDDFVQKELSFAGISETFAGIRMQIASDMRMPLTKLFGISSAGFNSGEDDIENYNGMVESEIRGKSKFEVQKMVELRCQNLFGYIPDDITIEFKPLRVLSAEQEENVKTQKFARLLQARQATEITSEEFRDGCNSENLLPLSLDDSSTVLSKLEKEKEPGNEKIETAGHPQAPKAPKSTTQAKEAKV